TDEMQQFITAVAEDKPVSVNVDDGLQSVAIALAAQKSALTNRPVRIDEILLP
ncbi:MAG TPA: inositol 2-dehydrogenase, partial [Clostridiales bacterium]|nr:inositol 2-dehydrogenase [Clostridiales bacterium]